MNGNTGHIDDTRSVEELYRTIGTRLRGFFIRRVPSEELGDELVQEAFARLLSRLQTGAVLKDPSAYLFRIARNLVIDHYRKAHPYEVLEEPPDDNLSRTDVDIQRRIIAGWLTDFVRALPPPYSETLRLAEIEQLPYARIADDLGIRIGTVKSRVSRGRRLLRHALLQCCQFAYDARGRVVDYEAKQCSEDNCEQC